MHFLYDHIGKEDENLGSVKQCVNSIDVSSFTVSHIPIIIFFQICFQYFFLIGTFEKKENQISVGMSDVFF